MKKSANVDIRNLFRRFGGDADNYQEIQQNSVAVQAQQSWPIVQAMEKERASAPTLRATATPHVSRASAPAASSTGLFAAQPAAAVAKPAAPAPAQKQEVAGARTGGFAAVLMPKPAPVPANPVRSLFGAPNPAVKPAATFAPMQVRPAPVQSQPAPAQPVQIQVPQARKPRENDQLDAVFSRLLNPQKPEPAALPDKGLRGLLGFLKK